LEKQNFKGISTVLKLETNLMVKVAGKTVLLKAYWNTPPEVGTIEIWTDACIRKSTMKEESCVPK
jgi:hypothetical protein